MKITQAENETLQDALARLLYVPPYDPMTMTTASDLAARMGTTKEISTRELERLVKAGELDKVTARKPNGHNVVAYVKK